MSAYLFLLMRSAHEPTLKIGNFQDMGSHTPPEDRQARLSGAGRGYIRQRRNSRTRRFVEEKKTFEIWVAPYRLTAFAVALRVCFLL